MYTVKATETVVSELLGIFIFLLQNGSVIWNWYFLWLHWNNFDAIFMGSGI